jgi:Mycothiol maleylpyruvate isomerase N-terminal domain
MSHADGYLGAAGLALALLQEPEVASAWSEPSALAEMTVGGLAAHLASQVFLVGQALDDSPAEQGPIPLLEHYSRATWVGAPLDSAVNAGIRSRSEGIAAEGAAQLTERAGAALARQRAALPGLAGDRAVFMPWVGWALTLDDFLTTRTTELAVHMDDLAVSVGHAMPELPDAAFDPVLTLLARLAARRHGQAALVRALARAERAPVVINAI